MSAFLVGLLGAPCFLEPSKINNNSFLFLIYKLNLEENYYSKRNSTICFIIRSPGGGGRDPRMDLLALG